MKEMQTDLGPKRISASIVELYQSTKKEMTEYLADSREVYPSFTLVADFWTCKTTNDKYLGLRVYLVDKDWQFKSVLLGTKPFNPAYSDREGGIQKPFRMWLMSTLADFDLKPQHFCCQEGASTSCGIPVGYRYDLHSVGPQSFLCLRDTDDGTLFTLRGLRDTWVQDCGYKMGNDVVLSDWLKQLSIQ
ncbi:hypothetical protein P3T76_010025 [Phytophthora citrophthora]|uniref:Uncharacterized protein n=1 Tax=Phytophthora citrophthora TaxID=4793 RepID=A0AAD9LHH8_9STRA|nr:hypothetical protein P3T76_010025 [Phytophthora citrophthora]